MRVRISYSVDLDEVTPEISDLVRKKMHFLDEAGDLMENVMGSLNDRKPDYAVCLSSIDNARQKLAQFDMILSDAHLILSGYMHAVEEVLSSPLGPPTAPSDGDV